MYPFGNTTQTMQWFKFYGQDFLTDPKMRGLSIYERACWVVLLCLANAEDKEGQVSFIDEVVVMHQAGVEFGTPQWDATLGFLKKFQKLGMVTVNEEIVTITNWEKRQQRAMTGAERVRKWRERRANVQSVTTSNANRNGRVDKSRVEKNRITTKDTPQDGVDQKVLAEVIDEFKVVNPTHSRLFGMPPQRAATARLMKQFGTEKLVSMIRYLPKSNSSRYAPTITTPAQLERDLGKLVAWAQKEKDTGKKTPIAFV